MRRCILAVLLGALVGCAPTLPEPHPAVANRAPLPACGVDDLRDGPPRERTNVDARRCLIAAWEAGEPAELIRHHPELDGGPTTTIFRALGDGRMEVFQYGSEDGTEPGTWRHSICADLLYGDQVPVEARDPTRELVSFILSDCEVRDLRP